MREVKLGDSIVFIDSLRRSIPALVQAVHGTPYEWGGKMCQPCINLIHLSQDENKIDQYGRQIEHVTSLSHFATFGDQVVGMCWHFPEEEVVINTDAIATQR